MMAPNSQANLPEAVKVPAGNSVVMETSTLGGEITYQCRAKKDMADQFEWVFAGPPATWESVGGSMITGTQVAVAPNGDGNIPNQLVKAN